MKNIKKRDKKPFFEWPEKEQKTMFLKVIEAANKEQLALVKRYEDKMAGVNPS